MGKLETPAWITEGYDSKADWERAHGKKATPKKSGKTYKVKVCLKCGSNNIGVILGGEEGRGSLGWECKKCKWQGKAPKDKELSENEFLKLEEEK